MSDQTISCQKVIDYLCENLDEDVQSAECEQVKVHLSVCSECARYLQSLKTTINLYKGYPCPQPSESVKRVIEDHIQAGGKPTNRR